MSRISCVLWLCFVFFGTLSNREQEVKSVAITGTLMDKGPVKDAEIDLQSLGDEHCAKLFVRQARNAKAEQQLKNCVQDLASTHADTEGHYGFSGLTPGWYAIHFVWSIAEKPTRLQTFEREEWVVMYPGYKDKTGRYDAFAQGKPFFLSGEADAVKDFLLVSVAALGDQRKPATPDEQTLMTGRLLGAIEDAGGGYTKEALRRFSWINKELEKREYSTHTRWSAHYWYAQALLNAGRPQEALEILRTAEQEANALTEKEREQTAQLTRQTQEKLSKK
jgi:hypothetical protein